MVAEPYSNYGGYFAPQYPPQGIAASQSGMVLQNELVYPTSPGPQKFVPVAESSDDAGSRV